MPKSDTIRLRHAVDAAHKAIRFTAGMTVEELRDDDKSALATLHAIALVGEALGQISPGFRAAHPEVPWKEAIGMRNRLIHGYDDVDHARVLDTVRLDLPPSIEQAERILGSE